MAEAPAHRAPDGGNDGRGISGVGSGIFFKPVFFRFYRKWGSTLFRLHFVLFVFLRGSDFGGLFLLLRQIFLS